MIFALHQKPSRRPLELAALGSIVWALASVLLGWAMLASELQRAPTFMEMLARPTAITLGATVIIPIVLFWFLALLSWRAQELRLMSSAMTEVAIRLAEPDRMAEQQIASVGQAVRRQVSFMDEAISRALGRAGELETLVHNEVANLERSYSQNEQRIRVLVQELTGERHALLNTSQRVSSTLRELGTEIPSLVEKLGDQQIKLAKFIEDAGQNLVALENSLATNATQLAHSVGARTAELNSVLVDHTQGLDAVLIGGAQAFQLALSDGSQQLRSSLDDGTHALQSTLADRTQELQGMIETRGQEVDAALAARSGHIEGLLTDHSQRLDGALATHYESMETVLTKRTDEMQGLFDSFSGGLDQTLGVRSQGLQAVLEEYTRALDATLASRQDTLGGLMVERTKAVDEAFAERLRLFDDSIVRSTIAVDSMVADKARALTTALEVHAQEIGQVLGRQAGELDEQLMHGVNAVRRASENVSRQSLKAIEGLAGQADLLKNVSENLVNQISSVTNRFDQQGQTIMRAANALETANYRIDKTLQNRQQELSHTLDQLSTRTGEIDRLMTGYSTSLEGTFTEAEVRARSVGDQLARSAEERARQMQLDLDKLQSATAAESDRALADLRAKYANVTREVSDDIGSLSTQFAETSEEMRRRAQRTLGEIESEQARLKEQLERLPEATRASAEGMRASLQEQIKALEQLSSLSGRERTRGDVSAPLSLPPATPAKVSPARSISSITQSLANEMANRARHSELSRNVEQGAAAQYLVQQPAPGAGSPPRQPGPAPQASASALLPVAQAGLVPSGYDSSRDGWSLGDLLARASQEEAARNPSIDIQAIAQALDATTAAAIWLRFRNGQRGIMVRSIYSNDGQNAFDEVQHRYGVDPAFQQTVDRYMADFERVLREADQLDPSGHAGQSYVVREQGRVYLFLAHASGRLA